MENQTRIIESGKEQSRAKEIAVTAMLIAIGAVLRIISPNIAGITPNWVIAMYCLAIILVEPKILQAMGIGLVAGAVSMISSKSPIPYLNLITEPVGALVCVLLVMVLPHLKIGRITVKPIVATALGTLASGTSYVFLNKVILSLPLEVAQAAFLTVVIPVTIFNSLIAMILYYPAKSLFKV